MACQQTWQNCPAHAVHLPCCKVKYISSSHCKVCIEPITRAQLTNGNCLFHSNLRLLLQLVKGRETVRYATTKDREELPSVAVDEEGDNRRRKKKSHLACSAEIRAAQYRLTWWVGYYHEEYSLAQKDHMDRNEHSRTTKLVMPSDQHHCSVCKGTTSGTWLWKVQESTVKVQEDIGALREP